MALRFTTIFFGRGFVRGRYSPPCPGSIRRNPGCHPDASFPNKPADVTTLDALNHNMADSCVTIPPIR
jgi:hypothetical protein